MDSLPVEIRNQLARTVQAARRAGEAGARNALEVLAAGDARAHESLSPADQDLRRRLRAHGRQLGDRLDPETGVQEIDRLAHEVAYEHWHRMLFARFLAENDLLIEPESEVSVSLADCEELAREQGQDRWTLAGRFAERMLPRIFRSNDPALAVPLAPETRQELERLLESLPPAVFAGRDSLGWTYQFWQAERKEAVNKSGVKIGADELPAVTQLFTERYMVLFLLHNTVGAWRAGRSLAARPELAATATSEEELRQAVRLEAHGGYDFPYLRFVREPRDSDEAEQPTGPWRAAAGSFAGWPRAAANLRVLDPCCGSGHFLVECLDLLARLRMEDERLAPAAAVEAVLRDNLFGLEIDPRCTQIAAFNLALVAWTWPGAEGHRPLPALNLACSGLAPNASRDDWTAMAEAAADAGGLPAKRDLLGVDDSLMSAPLRNSLGALHDLFVQAPVLGSLIDPRALQADLFQHDYESVRVLLSALLEQEGTNDEQTERAVAAQGMARAADLLAGGYHLVITNVPYLARGKQTDTLKQFAQNRHPAGKADLATLFVSRSFDWLEVHGVQATVTPQNWLFLPSYKELRGTLLKCRTWNVVARLGPRAFETIRGHVVNVSLNLLSADKPRRRWRMASMDVSTSCGRQPISANEKATLLRGHDVERAGALIPDGMCDFHLDFQRNQLANPDAVIATGSALPGELLGTISVAAQGIKTGDDEEWKRMMWEIPKLGERWRPLQSSVDKTTPYGGRTNVIDWVNQGRGLARPQGMHVWGKMGVSVGLMCDKPVTLYTGEVFDGNIAPVIPKDESSLSNLWCFLKSDAFAESVNRINRHLKVDAGTVVKAVIEPNRWKRTAADEYPNGLPEPYSNDPTQWIFHGHPCGSVVWDEEAKQTTHGPLRVDARVLHVAVARLLVVCPRNDLAVARTSPNGSSNGDSGPNRRNASQIKRQLVQGTHH